MASPILLAEYLKSGFKNGSEKAQDLSLESLVILIGRYNLEYEQYYEELYNLLRRRETYDIKILKIVEISLRNSKLKQSTILPFMKLMLRKCLSATPLIICWFLGMIINIAKRNDSIASFFKSDSDLEDEFNTDLEFSEVEDLELKAFEILALRK